MSEKLDTKCGKCGHKAGSHNHTTGKHECLVYNCACRWFRIKKEKLDD